MSETSKRPVEGKYIEIIVDETGDGVVVEAHGFKGQGCQDATNPLIKALGVGGAVTEKDHQQETQQHIRRG